MDQRAAQRLPAADHPHSEGFLQLGVCRQCHLHLPKATFQMKINVGKVLAREKESKAEELKRPLPKVSVSKRSPIARRILEQTPPEIRQQVREAANQHVETNRLLEELEQDFV